jgi:hypothetical protein
MLMDHIAMCPCSGYVIQLHYRVVHVLEELTIQARGSKCRGLGWEVRRIRSGDSYDRHGDVVCLDFIMAWHRSLIVYATVTPARTNSSVLAVGDPLSLLVSHATVARNSKLDADFCTSSSLAALWVQSAHDYYPFALLDDWGRLAPMAVDLVNRLTILVDVR